MQGDFNLDEDEDKTVENEAHYQATKQLIAIGENDVIQDHSVSNKIIENFFNPITDLHR